MRRTVGHSVAPALLAVCGVLLFLRGADAGNTFSNADFKGVYVATMSGHLTGGGFCAARLYINSDGQGNVTGSFFAQDANTNTLGGSFSTTYTVTPEGLVQIDLLDVPLNFEFSISVVLADRNQQIFGNTTVSNSSPHRGIISTVQGVKQ